MGEPRVSLKKFIYALPLFFIFAVFPVKISFAGDDNPTAFIKNAIDRCFTIFKSEKNEDLQKEQVLNIMKIYFDFPNIAENLLSGLKVKDADKLSLAEIFPLLLEKNYSIYVKSPKNLSVEYKGYEISDGGLKAIVHTHTKIFSHSDIDLDYKLHRINGEWKIYDLTVGNTSLVGNYREQIRATLKKMSFQDFLIYLEKIINKKTDSSGNQQS